MSDRERTFAQSLRGTSNFPRCAPVQVADEDYVFALENIVQTIRPFPDQQRDVREATAVQLLRSCTGLHRYRQSAR